MGGLGFIFGTSCRVGYGYWARGSGPWVVRASKKSARAISSVLHYAEAATDHELYYYYYTTMDELLHPETNEKLALRDSIIFLRYARGSIRARDSAFVSHKLNEKKKFWSTSRQNVLGPQEILSRYACSSPMG